MPELPEVETVRRGLEPAMDGARFTKVEVRRGDLRWPLPKDFAQRLNGKTVTGLGRRAKYLLADLSSGDVLVMHLGMSGSFHVFRENDRPLGRYYHEREKHVAHDHVVFHMSSGATVTFNDPRRFGSMKLVPRAKARRRAAAQRARPRAARQCIRCRHAGARLPRQEDEPEGGAAGPAHRRRPRQYLCLRGAVSRAAFAQAHGLDDRRPGTARRTSAPNGWSRPSRRCSTRPSRAAARRCATTGSPTAISACSSTISASTIARASRCPTPGCGGTVKRIVQNGRSTFYCPACQK